jgi:LemA protein
MLGFHEKAYFKADAGSEKAPEVNFDDLEKDN